jgi:hypothetical protein
MLINEFIETYGQAEAEKLLGMQMREGGVPMSSPSHRTSASFRPGSGGRASPKGGSMSPGNR